MHHPHLFRRARRPDRTPSRPPPSAARAASPPTPTLQQMNDLIEAIRRKAVQPVEGHYWVRLPEENVQAAFEAGFAPFCPLVDGPFLP